MIQIHDFMNFSKASIRRLYSHTKKNSLSNNKASKKYSNTDEWKDCIGLIIISFLVPFYLDDNFILMERWIHATRSPREKKLPRESFMKVRPDY